MKIGDLVVRTNPWVKHNPWMLLEEKTFGIIFEWGLRTFSGDYQERKVFFVLWSSGEIRCEYSKDIEVINESG